MKPHETQRLVRELTRQLSQPGRRKWLVVIAVVILGYAIARPLLERSFAVSLPDILAAPDSGPRTVASPGEQAVLSAFEKRRSDVIVEATATVKKNLPDDDIGDRHQKMILKLLSGHTLLLAHNIDLAPRVPVRQGEEITFRGEYEYTEPGGVIHWTHHDPTGRHEDGWIRHHGKIYQ